MRRILVTLATVAAVTMLAVTTMVFVNIHPANAATKSALAAQSTLPNDGPLTPGEYLTRSVLPNGTVTYTPNVTLKPDGKVHRWRYNIQCADGSSGCFVLITASNTPGTPGKVSSGLSPNSCGLSCQTNYETLTNDYVTCTGFFGSCGAYTEAMNSSYMWWSSIDTGDISITPSCGAAAWECQGVGGTYTQYGNQCSNCTLSAYGPQLYSSVNLDRSQTKYSYILLKPGGANQNQYLCTGDLC